MAAYQDRQGGIESSRSTARVALACLVTAFGACGEAPEPAAIQLVDRFSEAEILGAVAAESEAARTEWRFDDTGTVPIPEDLTATGGWEAISGVEGLTLRDGHLVGRTSTETGLIAVATPENPDPSDLFQALEIELRAEQGTNLAVAFVRDEELDREMVTGRAKELAFFTLVQELRPGSELQTYKLTSTDANFNTSFGLPSIRHILIRPTDAAEVEFEIARVRLVSLKEHLASISSGVGWHGLGDVFRETIVTRSPERVTFQVDLPSQPFLDLTIGTVDNGAVTFTVEVDAEGEREVLLQRTLTSPLEWNAVPLELGHLAGRTVALSLSLSAEEPGRPGFWGSPVVRNRAGTATIEPASETRTAVIGEDTAPPQGVILIIADTLRRDHFQPYGHDRWNAPVLTFLAQQGALFQDNISQGAWTKVSVSSIVSSLYPPTHGIQDMPDRMPAAVTTLAEAYRSAGYATFATSSVPFTGRLTNLHQGVEVLHESTSVGELDHSDSKTSRTYVDRLVDWIEIRKDVPFFAFLHIFDPHSPFEPYRPYESLWMEADDVAEHREQMEQIKDFIKDPFMRRQSLPTSEELAESGLDAATFLERERIWYDASIKAMDVEVGRLLERLAELGLSEDTLIAFVSDHGEEFLEHGRHFHGYSIYGEMLNVPLFLWWPDVLPAGVEVAETVQSIDLMPTLLELSRLPVPEQAQGQSLLPLLAEAPPAELGWKSRPAFAELALAPIAFQSDEIQTESWAVVHDGWKLIRNGQRPEDKPEFELFDHRNDPLNLTDVAPENPEIVERLAGYLEGWHAAAVAARIESDADTAELSEAELEQLRSLGYLE